MTDEELTQYLELYHGTMTADVHALANECIQLREENRRLAFQLEKTAKRFDAMKFKDFASECRAAIEGSK